MNRKIYITGISGTGKTTLAKKLAELGYLSISIDEVPGLCGWYNKETKKRVDYEADLTEDFIKAHEWLCDVVALKQFVDEATVKEIPFIAAGVADNQDEYLSLFDTVVLLKCGPEIFLDRINKRIDNDFGKEASAQEFLRQSYQSYEKAMIEKGAIIVNAELPVDMVLEEFLHCIKLV